MCKAMYVVKKHDLCPPVNMTLEGVDWFFHWYLFFWQNAHVSLISAFFFLPYSVCRPTVHVVLALPLYIQTLVWTSCFLLLFTEDNIVVVNKKKQNSVSAAPLPTCSFCVHISTYKGSSTYVGIPFLRSDLVQFLAQLELTCCTFFFFLANFTVMEMAFPLKSLTYVWDDVIGRHKLRPAVFWHKTHHNHHIKIH